MTAPYVTREALAARSPALARAIAADAYRYEPRATCAGADNANLPGHKNWKKRKPKQIDAATWLKRQPAGSALLRSMIEPARAIDAKRLAAETREQQEARRRAGR